jgi:hypothetical protein
MAPDFEAQTTFGPIKLSDVNDNIRMYKKWNLIMYKNVHR